MGHSPIFGLDPKLTLLVVYSSVFNNQKMGQYSQKMTWGVMQEERRVIRECPLAEVSESGKKGTHR